MYKAIKLFLIGLFLLGPLLLALPGCQPSDSSGSILKNYTYRLSNSLDVERPPLTSGDSLAIYPNHRQLAHAIPAISANLLEFLRLSRCELQRHIGQRNSSLGAFMKGSQRLIYEYRFIELAEMCLQQLGTEHSVYPELQRVLVLKREQLPQVRWNAVFASEEMATLFSLGTAPLSATALGAKPVELFGAIENLSGVVSAGTLAAVGLEADYAVLASSKRLGALRLTMQLFRQHLQVADTLLQQRVEKPLCYSQKPNAKFAVVNTVFLKFYIGEVQPLMAKLHQEAEALLQLIDSLQQPLLRPASFDTFWQQVYMASDSEWNLFNQAIADHTRNWQALLKQCGKLPA